MPASLQHNPLPRFLLCALLGLLCALLSPLLLAATLSASVNKSSLGLDETLTLQLSFDERISGDAPDLTALQKDFEVLGSRSESRTSIINNAVQNQTNWIIELAPRKIGQALIPSFSLRGAISDAIPITVTRHSQQAQQNDIRVETFIEPSSNSQQPIYVQQQILLVLRLTLDASISLNGGNMEPLNVKDALVVALDEKKYQRDDNGKRVNIIENRYAIYPQTSGELIIPSVLFQLDVGAGSWDMRSMFGGTRGNLLRLRSDEKALHIEASPQDARAQPWLPAEDITLEEHWSSNPEQVRVGEPITRTIRLHAKGLSAAQIPPLPTYSVEGLSHYQDQAQSEEKKTNEGMIGTRIETTAIVANRTGSYELPAVRVNWWDTRSGQFKTAEIAATRLRVGGIDSTSNESNSEPAAQTPLPSHSAGEYAATAAATTSVQPWWFWLVALSLALNVLLLWLYARARRNGQHYSAVMDAVSLRAQATEQQAQNERQAWQQLREVLDNGSKVQLRTALLHWGQAYLRSPNLSTLDALGQALDNSELHQMLLQLDASLYGTKDGDIARDTLKALLANLRKKNTSPAAASLKPLYPQ